MNRLTSIRALAAGLALVGVLTDAQAQIVSVTPYTPSFQGISEATATIQASAGTAYAYVMQINLDGGGSTSMVVEGANGKPDVLENPFTGAERYDGNNLGVYALPLAPVPLPPSVVLFGSVLLGLMAVGRRQLVA